MCIHTVFGSTERCTGKFTVPSYGLLQGDVLSVGNPVLHFRLGGVCLAAQLVALNLSAGSMPSHILACVVSPCHALGCGTAAWCRAELPCWLLAADAVHHRGHVCAAEGRLRGVRLPRAETRAGPGGSGGPNHARAGVGRPAAGTGETLGRGGDLKRGPKNCKKNPVVCIFIIEIYIFSCKNA